MSFKNLLKVMAQKPTYAEHAGEKTKPLIVGLSQIN